jgi:hypothetical protein
VAGLQERQLPDSGVCRHDLVAVSVGLLEQGQLRAGVGAFPTHDQAHPARPPGQVQQCGDLGDVAALAHVPIGVDRGGPRLPRQLRDGIVDLRPAQLLRADPAELVMIGSTEPFMTSCRAVSVS